MKKYTQLEARKQNAFSLTKWMKMLFIAMAFISLNANAQVRKELLVKRTGTITTTTTSSTVNGVGTLFTTELAVGNTIINASGTNIGVVLTIGSNTSLTLTTNAAVAVSGASYFSSDFTTTERTTLFNLMMQYIDVGVVYDHCNYMTIHNDYNFIPFHHSYIEGMEDFLMLQGFPQYVPLPAWDPSTPTPQEFKFVDPDCSDISLTCSMGDGPFTTPTNWVPNKTLPAYFKLPIVAGIYNDICDFPQLIGPNGISRNLEGGSGITSEGDPDNSGNVAGSNYHNNVHGLMGGVMLNFRSPSAPIFFCWHAWVDDLYMKWKCNCQSGAVVDLYMKDTPKIPEDDRDVGEEPNIDNGPMWISEDIWVRNNPDGFTNQIHEDPVAAPSVPVFVYVRVRNRGCSPSLGTEQINLRWAKAATSLSWPSNWDGSTDLDPGIATALAGDIVATQTISTPILAGGSTILEFAWFPPNPSDYSAINTEPWHFCLLARVEASNDPMFSLEGGDVSFNTKLNNNIVWKNITIIDNIPGIVAGGGDCPEDIMQNIGEAVAVANPYDEPATFDITFAVSKEELKTILSNEGQTIIMDVFGVPEIVVINSADLKDPGKPITEEGTVMIALDNQLYEKWVQGGKKGTGFTELLATNMSITGASNNSINSNSPIVVSDRKMFEITDITATFENITLQGKEFRTTSMMVLYPTNPVSDKQEFKYDIIQKRTDNGQVIGGVRYDITKPSCADKVANAGSDKTIDKGCSATLTTLLLGGCSNYWWIDQNGNVIAKNSNVTVSPMKTTTYTLKTVSEEGCISEDKVIVNVTNQLCLKKRAIVKVSPNPADDIVNVKYKVENTSNAELRLVKIDNSIDRIYNLDLLVDEILLNIADCPFGIYTIILVCDGVNVDSKTIIIQ